MIVFNRCNENEAVFVSGAEYEYSADNFHVEHRVVIFSSDKEFREFMDDASKSKYMHNVKPRIFRLVDSCKDNGSN